MLLGSVAAAQEAPDRPEEIVVYGRGFVPEQTQSATKTNTPLRETPQSISIVNRHLLDAWGTGKLTEALRHTPGVQAEPFGIEPRFTNLRLRGFDAATTGLFRDGLLLANPGFAVSYNLEPWGAEQLEIPRGPASVLYGQASPGGLINYVSKRPTSETIRELGLEFGNYDRVQGRFDFAGAVPRNPDFAYRLVGLVRDADTQIDFVEEDRVYVAPSFMWRPTEATSFTLLASHQQDDTMNSQALPAPGTVLPNPQGRVPIARFTGEPGVDDVDRTEYSLGYTFDHRFSDAVVFRQNLRWNTVDLNDVVVFSNGIDSDLRTIERGAFGNFGNLDGFTVDNQGQFQLRTGPFDHTVLVGVDYQHIDARSRQQFGVAPPIDIFDPVYGAAITLPPPFKDDDIQRDQLGYYMQDQVKFRERLVLTVGGRYDDASSDVESDLFGTSTEQDDDEFTARVGVIYLSDTGFAPYVSYAESFLPASGSDALGRAFAPETGTQYELGVKFQPRGHQSFITLAVFDLERQNIVEIDPATFLSVQTGEARSQGVELETVASFDFGLDLVGSYTYLDTEITESALAAELGNRLSQIPEHSAALWAQYTVPAGLLRGLGLGAGVRHQAANFGDRLNSIRAPAFTLADANIHYDWRQLRFQINAHNLFDKEYAATCFARGGANFCTFGEALAVRGAVHLKW